MRVFIQDRDIGQLDALERRLLIAGHEPVVIYSLSEILDMAAHPHLAPDAVVAEAAIIGRTLRRLGEVTAAVLMDLLSERIFIATGVPEESLPFEVSGHLPRPVPSGALEALLGGKVYAGRERRSAARRTCTDAVEVHLYSRGTHGPYTARFLDLSEGGACVSIPAGGAVPEKTPDTTVDLWVQDGPMSATRLHGRLAWTAPGAAARGTRIGVEFFELTDAARSRIHTTLTA